MDMEALLSTFEKASNDLQNPQVRHEAEAVLMNFHKMPMPYAFCQFVLERSQSPLATFNAANIMRKALSREWTLIPREERNNLCNYVINYLAARNTSLPSYTKNQLLEFYAVLHKRGWLEDIETIKKNILLTTEQMMEHNHSMKILAAQMMLAIVHEFSSSKGSEIGMSWEFHERSRESFQAELLLSVFKLTLKNLEEVAVVAASSTTTANANASPSPEQIELLMPLLNLLVQVLTWDFTKFNYSKTFHANLRKSKDGDRYPSKVEPPNLPEWTMLITNPHITHILIRLHAAVRSHSNYSHLIRQAIIQLCSLSTKLFPDEDAAAAYVSQMLEYLFQLTSSVSSSDAFGTASQELFDCCQAILRLVINFKLPLFIRTPNFRQTFDQLTNMTISVVNAVATNADDEWFNDSLDALLDAWVALVTGTSSIEIDYTNMQGRSASGSIISNGHNTHHTLEAIQIMKNSCTLIFRQFIEANLRFGKPSTNQDNEGNDYLLNEKLTSLATLAREQPRFSLSLLHSKLSERLAALDAYNKERKPAGFNLDTLQDDIDFLLMVIGYVLADNVEGEKPLIPDSILALASPDSGSSDLMNLITIIMQFAQVQTLCLELNPLDEVLSTAVGERLLWFFERWTKSYLMPDESSYSSLSTLFASEYGEKGKGRDVAEFLLRVVVTNLLTWAKHETDLAAKTCSLLRALVDIKPVRNFLVNTATFQHVIELDSSAAFAAHPAVVRSSIMESLCIFCTGAPETHRASLYFKLLTPLKQQLEDILSDANFAKRYQEPQITTQIVTILERFRGVARASRSSNSQIIHGFFSQFNLFDTFIKLADLYHNHKEIVLIILQFFDEFVDAQNPYLPLAQYKLLSNYCIQLIGVYKKHNQGVKRVVASKTLDAELEEEQFNDILTLVRLLTHLTSKDFLDFGEDVFSAEVQVHDQESQVAEVVFFGLHNVLPLITLELLNYQKLCKEFFKLLNFLVEVYPEKVCILPQPLFQQIVSSLHFGMKHHDSEVLRLSYDALGSLCFHHIRSIKEREGTRAGDLQQQLSQNPGLIEHFLALVFHTLMFEDFDNEILSSISRTLFGLIVISWDQQAYQIVASKIISEQGATDANRRDRLSKAFNDLLNSNQVSNSIAASNLTRFQQNLESFLTDVRAFVQTK